MKDRTNLMSCSCGSVKFKVSLLASRLYCCWCDAEYDLCHAMFARRLDD